MLDSQSRSNNNCVSHGNCFNGEQFKHFNARDRSIVLDYYWILRGVLAFFTVFGNMVVIVLILRCPALRTKQNWFVLSLAVADFLVGIGFVLEIIAILEEI